MKIIVTVIVKKEMPDSLTIGTATFPGVVTYGSSIMNNYDFSIKPGNTDKERGRNVASGKNWLSHDSLAEARLTLSIFTMHIGALSAHPPKNRGQVHLRRNGRENHLHKRLRLLQMKVYFADPYSSWQRGTDEHGNWHLRYCFPKGTDFSKVTEDELQDVSRKSTIVRERFLGI